MNRRFRQQNLQIQRHGIVSVMELEQSRVWVNRLEFRETCDSTNLELLRLRDTEPGIPDFTAVVAGQQTGGRGRLERSWVSEPGASLSISILIKQRPAMELQWLTPAAALAVAELTAELLGLHPDEQLSEANIEIKWPNDVLVGGQKLSGILAQIHSSGDVVVGVGINLLPQAGAPSHAISLAELGASTTDLDAVLANFLGRFRAKANVVASGAADLVADSYRAQLSTLGKSVRVELADAEVVGVAQDVDNDGRLGVLAGGELKWFAAGDVVHLRN